jgi:hypothetical protein
MDIWNKSNFIENGSFIKSDRDFPFTLPMGCFIGLFVFASHPFPWLFADRQLDLLEERLVPPETSPDQRFAYWVMNTCPAKHASFKQM